MVPSIALIKTTTANSGNIKNSKLPIKIPIGSSTNENPTPQIPTIFLVTNNCMLNEIRLNVENQKAKKDARSSGSVMDAEAKSLNK